MSRPGRPENLKPFKKGQSGNPNGRPKKLPGLDELLADVLDDDKVKAMIEQLYRRAMKGDTRAANILLDRGWGKPKQQLDVTTGGEKIKISFKDAE